MSVLLVIRPRSGPQDSEVPTRQSKFQSNGRVRGRRLARRLEILRAAGRKFRLHGFAETGMRDIAEAAELSSANLYNYFRGKHEILFFCQDSALGRMLAALDHARRMEASAAEKLRLVIVSHMRCLLDEVEGSAAHLLPTSLPPRLQRRLMAKRDRYEKGVCQLIERGIRSGEFVPFDPALAARAVLGALNWSVRWFSQEGPLTATEIAEGFASYLIRGLLANPRTIRLPLSVTEKEGDLRNFLPESGKRAASVG
jgi:AcrR family transcriptional regulator